MRRRIPPVVFHPQRAYSRGSMLGWRPGWQGSGLQPIQRPPVTRYSQILDNLPLTGGQAQVKINAQGTAIASVGPQGLGVTWYISQATFQTTSGADDTSTAQVFLGSLGVPQNMVGQSYNAGQDTVGIAVPSLTPGDLLIIQWAGGHPGDLATFNLIGTTSILTTM